MTGKRKRVERVDFVNQEKFLAHTSNSNEAWTDGTFIFELAFVDGEVSLNNYDQ